MNSQSILVAIFTIFVGGAAIWFLAPRRRRSTSYPAGPTQRLWSFSVLLSNAKWAEILLDWSARSGNFLLRGLWHDVVVLTEPEAAHAVLGSTDAKKDMPRLLKQYKEFAEASSEQLIPNLGCTLSTPESRAIRKLYLQAFSAAAVANDFYMVKAKTLVMLQILIGLQPGVVLDIDDVALRISLDVFGVTQLGYDFQAVESAEEVLLLQLLVEVMEECRARQQSMWRRWQVWFTDAAGKGQQKLRIFRAFVQRLYADAIVGSPPPGTEDTHLGAQLQRMRLGVGNRVWSDERVMSELAGLMLWGVLPLGYAIAWTMYSLAAHPEIQDRLVEELVKAGVEEAPEKLEFATLADLPLLRAVVNEALRLYPPHPAGSWRFCCNPVPLPGTSGATLPRGTAVLVWTYGMHRSPRNWRDPLTFNPDRWMPETEAAASSGGSKGGDRSGDGADGTAGGSGAGSSTSGAVGAGSSGDGVASVSVVGGSRDADGSASAVVGSGGAGKGNKDGGAKASSVSGSGIGGKDEGPQAPLCTPRAFLPFSAGPRSCPAQAAAEMSIATAVALFVAVMKVELTGPPEEYVPQYGWVLSPKKSLTLKLTSRR